MKFLLESRRDLWRAPKPYGLEYDRRILLKLVAFAIYMTKDLAEDKEVDLLPFSWIRDLGVSTNPKIN